MTSDEGLNAYGAATWGQFFIYQGFNERAGWMHTSSGVDNVDEFAETVEQQGRAALLSLRQRAAAGRRRGRSPSATGPRTAAGERAASPTYRTHHGPIVRAADGRWIAFAMMDKPVEALQQSFLRTKATRPRGVPARSRELQGQLARTTRSSPTPRARSPISTRSSSRGATTASTRPSRSTAAIRRPTGAALHALDELPQRDQPAQRLGPEHQQLALLARPAPYSPKPSDFPRYMDMVGENSARHARASSCSTEAATSRSSGFRRAAFDSYQPGFAAADPGADRGLRRAAGRRSAQARGWPSRSRCCAAGTIAGARTRCRHRSPMFWGDELWQRSTSPDGRAGANVDDAARRATRRRRRSWRRSTRRRTG